MAREHSPTSGGVTREEPYLPQLDSVRAVSVFLVFLGHWTPEDFLLRPLPLGAMGVYTFYVLSGFLITRILLQQRAAAEAVGVPRLHVFRQFFIRRALRIFPIYYITLLTLAVHPGTPRDFYDGLSYYVCYLANVRFAIVGRSFGAHLWSLSVEEQFYLLWPFVVLFVGIRRLPHALTALGIAAIAFRAAFHDNELMSMLTPGCLDSFALGGGLAYVWVCRPGWERAYRWSAAVAAIVLGLLGLTGRAGPPLWWGSLLISLCGVSLIGAAGRGLTGAIGRIAEWSVLTYLGKISYGLYLYHEFVRFYYYDLHRAVAMLDVRWPVTGWIVVPSFNSGVMFFVYTGITILVSAASWRCVERPINDMRRRIAYLR